MFWLTRDSSRWITEAVQQAENILYMAPEDQERVLRAAQRAVTTWRLT